MPEFHLNGAPEARPAGASLADLVEGDGKGLAIARNGEVVPRAKWATTLVAQGDELEIVKAVQGGSQ